MGQICQRAYRQQCKQSWNLQECCDQLWSMISCLSWSHCQLVITPIHWNKALHSNQTQRLDLLKYEPGQGPCLCQAGCGSYPPFSAFGLSRWRWLRGSATPGLPSGLRVGELAILSYFCEVSHGYSDLNSFIHCTWCTTITGRFIFKSRYLIMDRCMAFGHSLLSNLTFTLSSSRSMDGIEATWRCHWCAHSRRKLRLHQWWAVPHKHKCATIDASLTWTPS